MSNYPSGYNEQPLLDDLLQPYEIRIKQLEDFIKKARSESELHYIDSVCCATVPYWFMKDEIV